MVPESVGMLGPWCGPFTGPGRTLGPPLDCGPDFFCPGIHILELQLSLPHLCAPTWLGTVQGLAKCQRDLHPGSVLEAHCLMGEMGMRVAGHPGGWGVP